MEDKFVGSLLGVAIGDSLGASKEGIFNFDVVTEIKGGYTDDTAMTIGVCESLIASKGFSAFDLARRFMENYEKEPWRGYGFGPQKIFRIMREEGIKFELDRRIFPKGSFGNGAAMRVAPFGLIFSEDPERLRKIVYEQSSITHSHILAKEGAAILAYGVGLALRYEKDILQTLIEFTKEELLRKKLEKIDILIKKKEDRERIVRELGNGIEAINSVPTALFSFLSTDSFEESLLYAVSLGGDADTIGAMTGALSGACYGKGSIPERWLKVLENKEYIEWLAKELYRLKSMVFPSSENIQN